MKRFLIVGTVLALFLAACGGDSYVDAPATTAGAAADPAQEDQPAAETTAASSDDGGAAGQAESAGVNLAVITIGDRTFEFDVTPGPVSRCDPDFFGAFWALGGGLDMLIVADENPNHDPPYVKVTDPDDSDIDWWASPEINDSLFQIEVPAGQSQVDSFTVDGNTVTGTATFIEKSALTPDGEIPASVPGTFKVTCEES